MNQNFFSAAPSQPASAPYSPVATGTSDSHAEDMIIDLNEQLVSNKPATVFMKVNSDAMLGAGIHYGDVVIVDRSIEARNGKVVIAVLNGEMLIRRLEISGFKKRLLPATPKLAPIEITESSSLTIWGVVTYVIHKP